MGIYGFRFVYHGDWADPEIVWHGHSMNIHEIEDPMWEVFCETADEHGWKQTEENFVKFCKKESWRMRDYAQMAIDCGNAERVRGIRFESSLFSHDSPTLRVYPA